MTSGRVLLSFCVVAMAPREAMLLKSFVRMLDGRTKQRWLFKPQQDSHEQQVVDLTFLGDEGSDSAALPGTAEPIRQLRMGVLSLDLYAKLERPLRPDELERELNRMGSLLVQAKAGRMAGETGHFFPSTQNRENFGQVGVGQPSSMWRPVAEGSMHSEFAPTTVFLNEFSGTVPASLAARIAVNTVLPVQTNPVAPRSSLAPDDGLRMLRWPHASLVSTAPRLKLAAFMVGTTSTLVNLQKISGQSMVACTDFVRDLQASGFLAVTPAPETIAVVSSMPEVVVGALRVAAPPQAELVKATQAKPAMSGLFARIRARLGMSTLAG